MAWKIAQNDWEAFLFVRIFHIPSNKRLRKVLNSVRDRLDLDTSQGKTRLEGHGEFVEEKAFPPLRPSGYFPPANRTTNFCLAKYIVVYKYQSVYIF